MDAEGAVGVGGREELAVGAELGGEDIVLGVLERVLMANSQADRGLP